MENQIITCKWSDCSQPAVKCVVFRDEIFTLDGTKGNGFAPVRRNLCSKHCDYARGAAIVEREETIIDHAPVFVWAGVPG